MRHPRLHRFLVCAPLLSVAPKWRWYRRWQGGHWERWYVETVWDDLWHDVERCSSLLGRRPTPLCRGTPTCEEWP